MARGRRVNSNGERSKQLLLEKAMELFSTNGYHQTKISDIVKSANLTQPTFYLYFQSKEILFNDLNEQFHKDLFEIIDNLLQRTKNENSLKFAFVHVLTNMFAYFSENPKLTKIGFFESDQSIHIKNKLINYFVSMLDNERGSYEVDVPTFAQSLLGSIERLTLSKLLTSECEPEKLAEDIVNIYFVREKQFV